MRQLIGSATPIVQTRVGGYSNRGSVSRKRARAVIIALLFWLLVAASASAEAADLPASFSWGNYNGHNWMTPVHNMQTCATGSAVFPVTGAFEPRYRIQMGMYDLAVDLSEQHMVSCYYGHCNSGSFNQALDSLLAQGCPGEACFPYIGLAVACNPCVGWETEPYKITSWLGLNTPSVDAIKTEILEHGPVVAFLDVYGDFYDYASGVYQHVTGSFKGGSGAVLYGWDDGEDCWLAKNQWGTSWGEVGPDGTHGWFRIRKGANECRIETYIYAMTPKCCTGTRGNVDMTGITDLSDLSALVSYLTGGGYVLRCAEEANVNATGIVDLSDLSALVSYLTGGGYVLPDC